MRRSRLQFDMEFVDIFAEQPWVDRSIAFASGPVAAAEDGGGWAAADESSSAADLRRWNALPAEERQGMVNAVIRSRTNRNVSVVMVHQSWPSQLSPVWLRSTKALCEALPPALIVSPGKEDVTTTAV